jgi:hypothetical protein
MTIANDAESNHLTHPALGNLVPKLRYVCDLRADLSQLRDSLVVQTGPDGTKFWKVEYQVVVLFGGTRLQAHLQWKDKVRTFLFLSSIVSVPSVNQLLPSYRAESAKDL